MFDFFRIRFSLQSVSTVRILPWASYCFRVLTFFFFEFSPFHPQEDIDPRSSTTGGASRVLEGKGVNAGGDEGIVLTDGNVFQVCAFDFLGFLPASFSIKFYGRHVGYQMTVAVPRRSLFLFISNSRRSADIAITPRRPQS